MKLRYLLPLIGLLSLQACQSSGEVKGEPVSVVKKPRLNEAASYNTQLGLAYLKQEDRPRAKRKLLLALAQAPNSPDANAAMAYFMEKSGDLEDARRYYRKAIAVSPKNGAQLNNYGAFLCRQGQYKQAESYFISAIKDINYEHTAGAYENAGLCAQAIPENEKAALYFSKALAQDPSRKQSLYELVTIELKNNHANEALKYLQKYPRLTLHDPTLLTLAVKVAHKAGKADLEINYKNHLNSYSENTGGKNEHNSING